MKNLVKIIKLSLGLSLLFFVSNVARAQELSKIPLLLEELKTSAVAEVASIERELFFEWGKTGSPTADLLMKRAEADMLARDFQGAANRFATVVEMSDGNAMAHLGRAKALIALGYYGPALDSLKSALEKEPQFYPAWFVLAQILEAQDKPHVAFGAYELVQKIHPRMANLDEALQRLAASVKGQSL